MRSLLIVVLLLALPCAAGEICVDEQSSLVPCPPGGIAYAFSSTGFSTEGEPCQVEADGGLRILVSSSSTDPHVNTGGTGPENRLYLWMDSAFAAAPTGYGFGWAHLQFHDSIGIAGYEAYSPQDWYPASLELTFGGCDPEDFPPALLGAFYLLPTPVESRSWGSVKAIYR